MENAPDGLEIVLRRDSIRTKKNLFAFISVGFFAANQSESIICLYLDNTDF